MFIFIDSTSEPFDLYEAYLYPPGATLPVNQHDIEGYTIYVGALYQWKQDVIDEHYKDVADYYIPVIGLTGRDAFVCAHNPRGFKGKEVNEYIKSGKGMLLKDPVRFVNSLIKRGYKKMTSSRQ